MADVFRWQGLRDILLKTGSGSPVLFLSTGNSAADALEFNHEITWFLHR
jgi:hypothetical protein